MCAAFSSTNRTSHGPPVGFNSGHAFGYPPHSPQPPQGYGPPGPGENASYYVHSHPPRHNGPSPGPGYGPGGPAPMHGRTHSMNGPPMPMPIPMPTNGTLHPNMNMNNNMPMPVPMPMSTHQQTIPPSLLLRQSPQTHKIILVHPSGAPITAPALYSLTSSPKTTKADYVLARGSDPNDPNALIGTITSHTFSSKYDLHVRGTPCMLKESGGGNNYNIEIPGIGKFKWVTDMENLSSNMWLKDAGKSRTLASYGKSKESRSVGVWKRFVGGKDRELVLHEQLGEFMVEVLLLSLYAVKMAKEGAVEAAAEIVGAVAGA